MKIHIKNPLYHIYVYVKRFQDGDILLQRKIKENFTEMFICYDVKCELLHRLLCTIEFFYKEHRLVDLREKRINDGNCFSENYLDFF